MGGYRVFNACHDGDKNINKKDSPCSEELTTVYWIGGL